MSNEKASSKRKPWLVYSFSWQRAKRSSPLVVALVGFLFTSLCGSTGAIAIADDSRTDLQSQLQHLQVATNIVLMIIPWGVHFRFRVDEKKLHEVSCVYQLQSGRG